MVPSSEQPEDWELALVINWPPQKGTALWLTGGILWAIAIIFKIYMGYQEEYIKVSQNELFRKNDDFQFIKENEDLYKSLKSKGWVSNHDRFEVGRIMDGLANDRLNTFTYSIHPADNNDGIAHHKISIEATSLTDREVFNFLEELTAKFPGQLNLKKISINKHADINSEIINQLEAGASPDMISTEISMDWAYMSDVNDKNKYN